MIPRLYVLRCNIKGQFYREQGVGEAHGTWHDSPKHATLYAGSTSAMRGLANLRAKFNHRNKGSLEAVPLADVAPVMPDLFEAAA